MNPCQTTCTPWCWKDLSGEMTWPIQLILLYHQPFQQQHLAVTWLSCLDSLLCQGCVHPIKINGKITPLSAMLLLSLSQGTPGQQYVTIRLT